MEDLATPLQFSVSGDDIEIPGGRCATAAHRDRPGTGGATAVCGKHVMRAGVHSASFILSSSLEEHLQHRERSSLTVGLVQEGVDPSPGGYICLTNQGWAWDADDGHLYHGGGWHRWEGQKPYTVGDTVSLLLDFGAVETAAQEGKKQQEREADADANTPPPAPPPGLSMIQSMAWQRRMANRRHQADPVAEARQPRWRLHGYKNGEYLGVVCSGEVSESALEDGGLHGFCWSVDMCRRGDVVQIEAGLAKSSHQADF